MIARAPAGLRRAGPLALAGLGANGANVIVTILVAHLLRPRAYGAFGQLIGVFLVLAIPGSALLVAVVRRVTAWESSGRGHRVDAWVARVRRAGYLALGLFTVAAIATRWWVADLLSLPSPAGMAEVLVAGAGWAMLAVDRGLLQSRRDYGGLARSIGMEAGARTLLTLVLVGSGLGVEGAALGLLGALVAGDVAARRSLARRPRAGSPPPDEEVSMTVAAAAVAPVIPVAGRRQLVADVVAALAALGLLAILQNLDVVIVGRESHSNVGPYTAISVSSKALVFLALVLSGYLLPEAATRSHRGQHAFRQLAVALGLLAVPATGLFGVAVLAPRTSLRLVFGARLVRASHAFATLAVAMTALAAAVLFVHYLLGSGRRWVVSVLGVTVVANAALLTAAHGRPVATARADLVCHAALAVVTGAMVVSRRSRAARASSRASGRVDRGGRGSR